MKARSLALMDLADGLLSYIISFHDYTLLIKQWIPDPSPRFEMAWGRG